MQGGGETGVQQSGEVKPYGNYKVLCYCGNEPSVMLGPHCKYVNI